MDHATALTVLRDRTDAFAAALADADPAAPVPTCPGWTVVDLADHLGRVHLWAAHAATHDAPSQPYPRRDADAPLAEWYTDAAATLLAALATVGDDDPCWSFALAHARGGFWSRRQVHETAIHLLDLELATGAAISEPPGPRPAWLTEDLATDGVQETLTVFLQRALDRDTDVPAADLVPATSPVVVAVENGPAWTVRLEEGARAVAVTDGADPAAVATVSADPVQLHLALWGRGSRDLLEVTGDEEAGRRFLAAPLVP